MQQQRLKYYIGDISAELLAKAYGLPLYVYGADIIRAQFLKLRRSLPKGTSIYFACKANANPEILKLLQKLGSSVECVSKEEVVAAMRAGFTADTVLYTCSYATTEELTYVLSKKIKINIDSLGQLNKVGKMRPGSSVSIRINQGIGAGHHSHVITGGKDSKFGIYHTQINDIKKVAHKYKLKINGLHKHIGSNVLDEKILSKAAKVLLETAKHFPDIETVDFGGGLGIPYRPNEKRLDLIKFGKRLQLSLEKFAKELGRPIHAAVEPGRFLVAEAGVLLAQVTDIKKTPHKTFVGVNSGFNHLLRPAMYGAYHEIINASNLKGKKEKVTIVGNVCESGDIFGEGRLLSTPREGDILAILNAGAYGYTMSSNYNLRLRPAEVLVEGKKHRLIRKRQ